MTEKNLQDFFDDPDAQQLVNTILKEVGLGEPVETYNGEGARDRRIDAAYQLKDAIAAHHDDGFDEPIDEVLRIAIATAERLEYRANTLRVTYEIFRMTLFGHLLLRHIRDTNDKPGPWTWSKDSLKNMMMNIIDSQRPLGRMRDDCDQDCDSCDSGGNGGCGGCSGC